MSGCWEVVCDKLVAILLSVNRSLPKVGSVGVKNSPLGATSLMAVRSIKLVSVSSKRQNKSSLLDERLPSLCNRD